MWPRTVNFAKHMLSKISMYFQLSVCVSLLFVYLSLFLFVCISHSLSLLFGQFVLVFIAFNTGQQIWDNYQSMDSGSIGGPSSSSIVRPNLSDNLQIRLFTIIVKCVAILSQQSTFGSLSVDPEINLPG